MSEAPVVRFEVEDGIGVITVDYPPVNALGPGVREGIIEAVDKGNADSNVKAMVLIGAGRSFIAGADIRQFGKPRPTPARAAATTCWTRAPSRSWRRSTASRWAAGSSTRSSSHYRVAVPSAKVGLPEVLIGILPGGGGTQRLPRLIGPKAAMDMIVSGRHVPAAEAKTLGIIDEIVDEKDLRGAAIRYAKSIADKRPLPRVRDRTDRLAEAKADPGHVRGDAQVDREEGAQPEGALPLHRVRGSGGHAAVRGGAADRAAALRRAGELRRGEGAALRVLRRARGGQDSRRAEGPEAAEGEDRGRGRRGHHGRRHRDELRRFRHPGESARSLARGARQGHAARARQLRGERQARQPHAGRDGQAPAAHPAGRALRGHRGLRRRHRGGVRADRREEGRVHEARRGDEAGRAAAHQLLGDRHRHHGGRARSGRRTSRARISSRPRTS